MAEIKEDYVSFEIAKLLKEKGFDEGCSFVVNTISKGVMPVSWPTTNSDIEDEEANLIALPTLQMTMKWFREIHNIGIFPSTYTHISDRKTIHSYGTAIINLKTYELMTDSYLSNDTYEGAVEDAIKYCLENLI